MKMKRIFFPVLLASVMLVAMNLDSCKNSNKPAAAETSRIGEIPEAAQYIVGIETYNTAIDYSQAANWLYVPAALVKDVVLDGTAADSLKAVDVFYIYPTVTDFRPETEVCDMTADGAVMFGPESYHLHDYGFFFNNFKQNVVDRINAFLEK